MTIDDAGADERPYTAEQPQDENGGRSSSPRDEEISSEEEEDQRADPTKTKLTGQGLNGGHACAELSFQVLAHDATGSKCRTGGDDVVVRLLPSSQSMRLTGPINVQVTDHENGTYSVTYKVPDKGSYMMHVEVNFLPITGSPFPLFFGPPMTPAEAEAAAAAKAAKPQPATAATSDLPLAPTKAADDLALRTVYVSGLSNTVSLDHYRQLLAIQGRIKGIKMVGSPSADITTSILVVEFALPLGADSALKMNGMVVGARPLLVQSSAAYLMHQAAIANAIKAATASKSHQGAPQSHPDASLKVQRMNALDSKDENRKGDQRRSRSRSRDRRVEDFDRQRHRSRSRSRDRGWDRERDRHRHRSHASRSRSRDRVEKPLRVEERHRDRHDWSERDRARDRHRSRSRSRDRRHRDEDPERERRKKDKKDKKDKHKHKDHRDNKEEKDKGKREGKDDE